MRTKHLLFYGLFAILPFSSYSQDSTALAVEEPFGIYAKTPVTSGLELLSYTLETWLFIPNGVPTATGSSSDEKFLIETYSGASYGGFVLRIGTTGQIRSYVMGSAGQTTLLGNTVVNHGEWVHLAATYDENEDSMKVFLNGVQDGSTFINQSALSYTPSSFVNIGARGDDSHINYGYKMDEVRIWDYARTENEIQGDMNNCLIGNESGLELYYTFEDVTVNVVADGSGNGHAATIESFDPSALQDGVFDCCMVSNGVTVSGATITAVQTGATYQWMDCNTFSSIAGATSQSYTASVDGDYAVIVDDGICSDTSTCVNIAGVGFKELSGRQLEIYPNPALNQINIKINAELTEVKIISLSGHVLSTGKNKQIDISALAPGAYVLEVQTENNIEYRQFIKQ